MKERPIIFSGPMVCAILDGRKTQTRRAQKAFCPSRPEFNSDTGRWELFNGDEAVACLACPYGQPGDRLWVRETWYCDDYRVQRGPYLKPDDMEVATACDDGTLIYRASSGDHPYETEQPIWRPAIHMPRWASRITLEITDVRVERLNDISDADAKAEGADCLTWNGISGASADLIDWPLKEVANPHRNGFALLWESINGHGSWNANPWVWVVEFKRVQP